MEQFSTESTGVYLIALERARHDAEGFDARHDDRHHTDGELVYAAGVLSEMGVAGMNVLGPLFEPWMGRLAANHEDDRLRQLQIAGSLIAAEIDRLLRSETIDG